MRLTHEIGVEYRDAPVQWFSALPSLEEAEAEARRKSTGPRTVGDRDGYRERVAYVVREVGGAIVSRWWAGERLP